MAHGICELMWQNIILTEKDLFEVEPLMIYFNSNATLDIVHNTFQYGWGKHIEIDRYFIKEKLDQRTI
jgi:hypothetical protein